MSGASAIAGRLSASTGYLLRHGTIGDVAKLDRIKDPNSSLGISPGRVEAHRVNIYGKPGVSIRAELYNMFVAPISAMPIGGDSG